MLGKRSKGIKKLSIAFLLMFGLVVIFAGCSDNEPASVPISQKAVALKKRVKKTLSDSLKAKQVNRKRETKTQVTETTSLKIEGTKQAEIKRVRYKSNIARLRDPFVPFIKFTEKSAKPNVKKPLLPLQRYALSQLTLIAIIDAGKKGKWAMVRDSSGKGFTVREGMPLGSEGGVIQEIQPDQLIIKQTKVDLLGKKKVSLVALKLHPEKKGE